MAILIALARRYAPLARTRPALFLGLHLLALAGWVALAYVVYERAWAATRRLDLPFPVPDPVLTKEVLIATSIGLLLVGATLPAWGPHIGVPAMYGWATRYLACRRLYPLWRDLSRAVPDLALVPPTSTIPDLLAVQDLDLRLTHRMVEIRDARLALRSSMSAGVAEVARRQCRDAGLAGIAEQTTVEAACVAAALDARLGGWNPAATGDMPATLGALDLAGELEYLMQLADAYRRSPIVKGIRASLRPARADRSASASA